jgi:hypothetical protein
VNIGARCYPLRSQDGDFVVLEDPEGNSSASFRSRPRRNLSRVRSPWQLVLFAAVDLVGAACTWWTLAPRRRIAAA